MVPSLLAAVLLVLGAVLGPVPGATGALAAVDAEQDAGPGWAPRAPGWLDPGPRGRALAVGDHLRAPPRRMLRLPRPPAARRPQGAPPRVPTAEAPDLALLGRRQTDGG